eukprot:8619619-Alexandrium_andersonii.AAC.1
MTGPPLPAGLRAASLLRVCARAAVALASPALAVAGSRGSALRSSARPTRGRRATCATRRKSGQGGKVLIGRRSGT